MTAARRLAARAALSCLALAAAVASAAPPTRQAIIKACDETESAALCEKLIEANQMKAFPGIAVRDGDVLRLKTRAGVPPVELRDFGDPDDETGVAYRAYALWDYWPQRKVAVVSVMTQASESYLLVDLDGGQETRLVAEPLLSPDGQRFLVADLCDKKCGNAIQIWRFDRARPVRERTFKPPVKWYEAEVSWRDAATLAVEYSVPGPRRRFVEVDELELERARPRLLKLNDDDWTIDEARR